jgi:hypothetical protein
LQAGLFCVLYSARYKIAQWDRASLAKSKMSLELEESEWTKVHSRARGAVDQLTPAKINTSGKLKIDSKRIV